MVGNAASLGVGPYEVDNVWIDAYGVYTNNPPCGAMRGFGAVQACYAYESQMDGSAEACGHLPGRDPRPQRRLPGVALATGQVIDSPAPLADMLRELAAMPLPAAAGDPDLLDMPGGVSQTTHGEGVGAASDTASESRTSASPRASTTTPPPGSGWSCSAASRTSWCTRRRPKWVRAC